MQKWLEDNNGKYSIKKWVVDPNARVLPGVQPGGIKVQPGVRPGGILPAPPAPPIQGELLPGQQPAPAPLPIRRN
jgi:hypothetical protein